MSQNIKSSPLKLLGSIIGGLGQVAGAIDWGGKRKKERAAAQAEYDEMRGRFEGLDTSNLYGGVQNPYANMENVYEDLTVNQQEAQFMKQQQQQQQANIMQQMGGAAGGSGIAGLAQAMSNQGSIQAQRAAASIGKQEQATQMAGARGAEQIQTMERQGGWKAEMTKLGGASQARGLEAEKVSTLFGMGAERLGAAKTAQQQAKADLYGGIGQIAGGFVGGV